jgi:hypothetical protein
MPATEILCQCCSDVAITFEEGPSMEDGLTCACNSCGILGHVDIDCDEDGSYVRFWPLTESEAMRLENSTLIEAYLKNQEIIDRLMFQITKLQTPNGAINHTPSRE